ncbi:MarR family winged helix-turn-helix transcriptional regulator [Kitasatospora sp. NPDC091207]|uniref:MarR family winged helix-turn-helix transcriptional regulator n=1 Tax=Kitasatospora sp. NPDC091207 TaxID=3364083 RepID=UPI003804C78F
MEHPERRADETRDELREAPLGEHGQGDRPRDWTDGHVERWRPVLPHLDPDIEGAVTRMTKLVRHLSRVREQGVADYGLQKHEFDTLHVLAGRGGRAVPSDLRDDLSLAPASVTGRLEALERRGFIVRTPSTEDRRRVDIELTEAGRAAWREALDVVGREERRLLGVLASDERRLLSDLLRRVLLAAEAPGPGGTRADRPAARS